MSCNIHIERPLWLIVCLPFDASKSDHTKQQFEIVINLQMLLLSFGYGMEDVEMYLGKSLLDAWPSALSCIAKLDDITMSTGFGKRYW